MIKFLAAAAVAALIAAPAVSLHQAGLLEPARAGAALRDAGGAIAAPTLGAGPLFSIGLI